MRIDNRTFFTAGSAFVIACAFLLLPGGLARAGLWDVVVGSVEGAIAQVLFWFPLTPLAWALGAAGEFVNFTIQPGPITTSSVVQIGWTVTRDFANMLFILILLGIALDFILFNSFQVKKMLPRLLLIALLINFSLPIAGVVLDFANVFSAFFIEKVSGECASLNVQASDCAFTEHIANILNIQGVLNAPTTSSATNADTANASVLTDIIFAIFFIAGTLFIFLALGLMFLIRTGHLYVLLIILPIVLVLYAFPPTSGHFGRWTHRFIQWAMFGPAAAFFLYLSLLVFQANGVADFNNAIAVSQAPAAPSSAVAQLAAPAHAAITPPSKLTFTQNFFQTVYTYIAVWTFMLGSLFVAQAMGIKTAGAALSVFSKTGKWARGKLAAAGKLTAGAAARRAGVDKGLDKAAQLADKIPLVGSFAARGLRTTAVRTQEAIKRQEAISDKRKKELEAMSPAARRGELNDLLRSKLPGSGAEAAQIAQLMSQKGELVVRDANGNIDPAKTEELVRKTYQLAKDHKQKDAMKSIRKASPIIYGKIAEDEFNKLRAEGKVVADPITGELKNKETGETLNDLKNKAFDEMTGTDFENLKGSWTKDSVRIFMMGGAMTSGHIRTASNLGDHTFLNSMREVLEEIERSPNIDPLVTELKTKNRTLANQLKSGKLKDFGIEAPPKLAAKL